MSKSLKRVRAALDDAGLKVDILEMSEGTRTAAQAAAAAGCEIDQIVKSVIFCTDMPRGSITPSEVVLFLTAGGNQVDLAKASAVAQGPLVKADAKLIRAQTGFAIGGVSPVGHIGVVRAFMDPQLLRFDRIWAAAGTPRHIFAANPRDIERISGAQVTDFTS